MQLTPTATPTHGETYTNPEIRAHTEASSEALASPVGPIGVQRIARPTSACIFVW